MLKLRYTLRTAPLRPSYRGHAILGFFHLASSCVLCFVLWGRSLVVTRNRPVFIGGQFAVEVHMVVACEMPWWRSPLCRTAIDDDSCRKMEALFTPVGHCDADSNIVHVAH
jgi:hypothetical protein